MLSTLCNVAIEKLTTFGSKFPSSTGHNLCCHCHTSLAITYKRRHLAASSNPWNTLRRFQEEVVIFAASSYSRDAFGCLQEEISSSVFCRDGTGACCEDHEYRYRHYHRQTWKCLYCLKQFWTRVRTTAVYWINWDRDGREFLSFCT
jgi:hypothetical protein